MTLEKIPEVAVESLDSFQEVPLYYGANFDDCDDYDDDRYERWMMEDHPLRAYPSECLPGWSQWKSGANAGRIFRLVCVVTTIVLVIVQFVAILPNVFSYMLPETNEDPTPVAQWPSGYDTPNSPSRCLSYNPRTDTDAIQYAISAGCTGAKADIWLHGSDLLVGSSLATLNEKHTLQSLYLNPLLEKLQNRPSDHVSQKNPSGLFSDSAQSFVLMLEMKTSSPAALPMLVSQLNALRQHNYLTRVEGRDEVVSRPVTIILTGHKKTVDRPYHDVIFYDTSLDELALEDYDQPWKLSHRAQDGVPSSISSRESHDSQSHKQSTNAALFSATANFHDSIGRPRRGRFSPQQLALIRAQVQAAHRRGLKARYYGIPQGRGRLSEYIWRVLVNEGADLLDVDWEESYRHAWWRRWGTYRPS